jgi:anti-sigma factor RsiW
MNCREMSEFLDRYVAGELEPEVLTEFEHHIQKCGDCTVFVKQYRATIRLGAAAFEQSTSAEMPEELVSAILASITRKAT